jgi:hypothetical protein
MIDISNKKKQLYEKLTSFLILVVSSAFDSGFVTKATTLTTSRTDATGTTTDASKIK